MEWAAFQILEVMSSPTFMYKRIGYLAATQCFHKETEVLVLTPQTLRKVLYYLECLERVLTIDYRI